MNRNKAKANAVSTAADLITVTATLLAGFSIYGLLHGINDGLASLAGVLVGFVVLRNLGPIVNDGFRPIIDRLNPKTTAREGREDTDTKTTA